MPKISIITPTYNGEKFIRETIESVLGQTFTDFEYILIDDCSTDKTTEIIEEYNKKDQRIKLLKTEKNSGGPAHTKNIGLREAKGEYIAFLDHDDIWHPKKLEKQLEKFDNSNNDKLGLVICYKYISDHSSQKLIRSYNIFHKKNVLRKLLKKDFIITSSCVMIKKNIIEKVGLFDEEFRVSDDWDMWTRIAENGFDFGLVDEYLITYNIHNRNLSGHEFSREKQQKEFILFYNKHKSYFSKYDFYTSGYFCYINKNKKEAIKYFLKSLVYSDNFPEKIKSLAYVLINLLPSLEKPLKNLWKKINQIIH